MLISKEVEIKLNNRYLKYYIDKGYDVKNKKSIIVDVKDLPKQSHVLVLVECTNCKKQSKIQFNTYKEPYVCKKCNNIKVKKTKLERYGDEHYVNYDKMKQTKKEKYFDEHYTNREKFKNTCLNKYGVENVFQLTDIKEKSYEHRRNYLFEKYPELNFIEINPNNYKIKCNKNHIFDISQNLFYQRMKSNIELCIICNPLNSSKKSSLEKELLDFIKSFYNDEILENIYIGGKEIDIYLPKIRMAFEFNGLFWHNDYIKDKEYHKNKSNICDNKNITLIHIWEDDWLYKNRIVKNYIKSYFLNKIKNDNYIIEIKHKEDVYDFLKDNILEIDIKNNIKLTLSINNHIICILSFDNNNDIIINNFYCKYNYDDNFYLNELIKYIIKNYTYNNILLYIDRSFPKYYCNFLKIKNTQPEKYFIKNKKRILDKTKMSIHDAGKIKLIFQQ